jgi:hypothetical protein
MHQARGEALPDLRATNFLKLRGGIDKLDDVHDRHQYCSMNRLTLLRSFGILLLFAVPLWHASAGTNTVFDFLRSDVGARAAGMAGSFVTVMNDPNALFYNPASLNTLNVPRGSAGFFKHLLDINAGYVSYSQSLGDIGYAGAGILYTNYGSFTETDDAGNTLGSFSASDFAIDLGYANALDVNLYYGASVKFIYSSIAGYKSTGLAGDLGVLFVLPENRITLGASLRNIGAQISSYINTKEKLPLDLTVGGSIVPKGLPLLLNVNFHRLNDDVKTIGDRFRAFSIGGEFTLSRVLLARFGYDNAARKDLQLGTTTGLAGFSAGIGVNVSQYRLDYAISALGSIGNLHRISVSSSF